MSERRVFSVTTVEAAAAAVGIAREAGLSVDEVSLIARSDIELTAIPDDFKQAETDFLPAAARGAGYGAIAGTLAGLAAATFPPLGLTLAGAMIGGGAAGALVGSWSSALVGASIPEPLRREFEDEIEAGRILIVLDADKDKQAVLTPRLLEVGARPMHSENA